MLKKIRKASTLLLIGVMFLVSCKDDPASLNNGEPPQLPPLSSMEMGFLPSIYEDEGQSKTETQATGENFSQAIVRALVIKAIIDINLAIPWTLLAAASESEAELDGDEWVWRYDKTAGNHTYEVRLVATRGDEDDINWQLFVTNSSLNIDNKLFFSGTTNSEGTEGTWTYYNLQNSEEEPVSQTTWSINGEEDVDLRLEVTSDRNNNLGDYIEYTFDGTVKNIVYYNADKDQTTELQWNAETYEGFIIAPDYNNGEQACWDEDLEDISCS